MNISEAEVGKEYYLKPRPTASGINVAFIDAKITVLNRIGSYLNINFTHVSGHKGNTDIGRDDRHWFIVPVETEWDF